MQRQTNRHSPTFASFRFSRAQQRDGAVTLKRSNEAYLTEFRCRYPATRLSIALSHGTSNAVRVAGPCHSGHEDLSAIPRVSNASAASDMYYVLLQRPYPSCLTMRTDLSLAVWIRKARLLTVCAEKDGVWPADLLRETRTNYSSSIPRASGRITGLCFASSDR